MEEEWTLTCHSDGTFRYCTGEMDGSFSASLDEKAAEHVKALREHLLATHKHMVLENKHCRLAALEEQAAALRKELLLDPRREAG